MKRQNSFLSSSSQVEISSDDLLRRSLSRRRSKSFGCVSNLLHFLSNNNHSRRNKSITFVHNSNQEFLDNASSESKISRSPKPESAANLLISSSVSPPIAERSESAISTTTVERFLGARGPIVRLMGLESSKVEESVPEAAEKQRKVMEALEKCEQDLKALKEFIDALDSTESFRMSSPVSEGKRIEFMAWEQQQDPSPVSVLEELSRPRHFVNRHACNNSRIFHQPSANPGRVQSQQRQQMMQRKKKQEGDHIFNISKFERTKIPEEVVGNWKNEKAAESPPCGREAMKDSLEGVCKDISWGLKMEVGRIGLALQHQIFGDLLEELVKDHTFTYTSLPFEACRRRLCF
ncbi:uncharacterized protein LOC111442147 [Cucurbita moschata]|uniref:Uncharacterized protein LOC111442147 n=2 Tax=Cucurbita TaxID=3660 RepID=A0A6J1F9V5_CUCMO|nr:uncharacterized protein LOC111442147 [Cucurbita moschata]